MEFTTADVQVRISGADGSGTYSFRCPGCLVTVVKSAEPRTVDLLLASGVEQATNPLPAELAERGTGAPITHDDLLDFHDLLQGDDDWFHALTSATDTDR